MKLTFTTVIVLLATTAAAFAVAAEVPPVPTAPVPGPLLGALAGPWGLMAAAGAYGVYRLFKKSK